MPINYDGVYEVRIKYSTTPASFSVLEHWHTIDVRLNAEPDPGDLFSVIETLRHDGSVSDLETDVDNYIAVLDDIMATTTDFVLAELWKYPAEGEDGVYVSAYEIGATGAVATGATVAHQFTLTLRSVDGGIMRCQMMESALTILTQFTFPFPAGNGSTISNYLRGTTHPWVARDDSRPIAAIKISGTQNEKLARKRYRP